MMSKKIIEQNEGIEFIRHTSSVQRIVRMRYRLALLEDNSALNP